MRLYRQFHIALLASVLIGVCVLTLSDTLVDPVTARVSTQMSALFDAVRMVASGVFTPSGDTNLFSRSMVPFRTDTIGHFIAWSGVGFMAAGIPTTPLNRFNLYFGLFAMSAFLEAGQRYLSWSRVAEFSDLVANGLGLALGFLVFGLFENLLIDRFVQSTKPNSIGIGIVRRT